MRHAEMCQNRAAGARLREEELRLAQDLLFFGYRDFTAGADRSWTNSASAARITGSCISSAAGRASRCRELLGILAITKQSLAPRADAR